MFIATERDFGYLTTYEVLLFKFTLFRLQRTDFSFQIRSVAFNVTNDIEDYELSTLDNPKAHIVAAIGCAGVTTGRTAKLL